MCERRSDFSAMVFRLQFRDALAQGLDSFYGRDVLAVLDIERVDHFVEHGDVLAHGFDLGLKRKDEKYFREIAVKSSIGDFTHRELPYASSEVYSRCVTVVNCGKWRNDHDQEPGNSGQEYGRAYRHRHHGRTESRD